MVLWILFCAPLVPVPSSKDSIRALVALEEEGVWGTSIKLLDKNDVFCCLRSFRSFKSSNLRYKSKLLSLKFIRGLSSSDDLDNTGQVCGKGNGKGPVSSLVRSHILAVLRFCERFSQQSGKTVMALVRVWQSHS